MNCCRQGAIACTYICKPCPNI